MCILLMKTIKMKKVLFTGLFFLAISLWAQNNSGGAEKSNARWTFYAGGGPGYMVSKYYHSKSKLGYQFSGGATLMLVETPSISVYTQLALQWYKGISELHSQGVIYRLNQSFNTIQQFSYFKYNKFSIQPVFGGFLSYKFSDKYTYEVELDKQIIYTNASDGGTFYAWQIGFMTGLEKPISQKITLSLLFQYLLSHDEVYGLQLGLRYRIN